MLKQWFEMYQLQWISRGWKLGVFVYLPLPENVSTKQNLQKQIAAPLRCCSCCEEPEVERWAGLRARLPATHTFSQFGCCSCNDPTAASQLSVGANNTMQVRRPRLRLLTAGLWISPQTHIKWDSSSPGLPLQSLMGRRPAISLDLGGAGLEWNHSFLGH